MDASYLQQSPQGDKLAHISDYYADCFKALVDVDLPPSRRRPSLELPDEMGARMGSWLSRQKAEMGLMENAATLLVNPYSTTRKRDMSLAQLHQVLQVWHASEEKRLSVVSVSPHQFEDMQAWLAERPELKHTLVFTARDSIFELICLIALAQQVVSAETAIIHFANALDIPLLALMRQKTKHWAPMANGRTQVLYAPESSWVQEIDTSLISERMRHPVYASANHEA